MPNYPYSFQLPPLNVQDIPSNGVAGEFLGISAGGVLDWLPVSGGSGTGDLLAANNLSELTPTAGTARTNLGLGTSDSPTFANLTLTSPSLASSAPVTISQTWGTLNATYTAFKVNATESATSNSASRLLDLQLGSVSLCNVNRIGSLSIGRSGQTFGSSVGSKIIINGWEPAGIEVDSHGGGGQGLAVLYYATQAAFTFGANGKTSAGGISIPSGGIVGWAAQSIGSSNSDTILVRDGAPNTLALRNGAGVPQAFRVYNTYLGTTANEWFEIDWKTTAGLLKIGTTSGGTGVGRPIELNASGNYINFNIGTIVKFAVVSNRNLSYQSIEWNTDNTHDIGASGANRPRNLFLGGSADVAGTFACPTIYAGPSGNATALTTPTNGVFRITNNSATDFTRLQFGGGTDAFPAIARDGAGIKFTGAAAGSTAWIKVPPVAVSALPLAATAGAGARAFVNDALAPTFGSAVTGGGAVLVPVYSTGSAWHVG